MDKLKDKLGNSQRTTPHNVTTTTDAWTRDPWEGIPYGPNPECPTCGGSGFVHPLNDAGLPIYQKTEACPAPGCLRDSARAVKTGAAYARDRGVTEPEQTFDTFRQRKGTEAAIKYAKQFASGEVMFLLIYGGVGNGKTHLLNAIARKMIGDSRQVELITVSALLGKLREKMQDHRTDEVIRRYKNLPVLLLDDLGVNYGSQWEQATLEDLLVARFEQGHSTACTTNLDVSQLSERVKSRFADGVVSRMAHNSAGDYRGSK